MKKTSEESNGGCCCGTETLGWRPGCRRCPGPALGTDTGEGRGAGRSQEDACNVAASTRLVPTLRIRFGAGAGCTMPKGSNPGGEAVQQGAVPRESRGLKAHRRNSQLAGEQGLRPGREILGSTAPGPDAPTGQVLAANMRGMDTEVTFHWPPPQVHIPVPTPFCPCLGKGMRQQSTENNGANYLLLSLKNFGLGKENI